MNLDWIGETVLPRLLAAGLQSVFLVAAIWLLVRWLRPSAAVRCWLWWCASMQLLLGMLWPAPLELRLLPAQWLDAAEAAAAPAAPQLSPSAQLPFLVTRDLAARADLAATPSAAAPGPEWLSWPALFAALWLAGVIVLAAIGARAYLGMRRRVAAARDCEHAPALDAYRSLGASLGLRRLPPLRVSAQIDSPQLVGPPATVLLPQRQLAELSDDELAMALHHELTHLRRRDLWWGWAPALARHLFFFHPLAHLIAREYSIAREQACDAAVLDSRRYAAHDYGRLLLRLGVAPRAAAALAGASPTYTVLKRRLTMLQNSTSPARLGGVALAVAVAVLGLVPYKVTAAAEEATLGVAVASVAASGSARTRTHTQSNVTIHHRKTASGEQRITEINDGGDPKVWAIKDGQYFRVYDDGRYEPVRDAATRTHLDGLQRDAAQAEVDAGKAEIEAAKAMREADRAMREAADSSREAQEEARQARIEAARARAEAERDHAQAMRDAEQARRDADEAVREAGQARAQALREGEQARRNGEQARRDGEQAKREAQRAREQALRDGEQAKRNGEQARRNGEQVRRDAELARRNGEQARRNALEAQRGGEQARRDAEQARRNGEQARRDAEQAQRNADQASRDAREQAARDAQRARHAIVVAQVQRDVRSSMADSASLRATMDRAMRATREVEVKVKVDPNIDIHTAVAIGRAQADAHAHQAAARDSQQIAREALRATQQAQREAQRELADAGS
ncbi:hypothetical protein J5226_13260 [Lysobacter sp. K5869]|uniref:M56 family metallopeptidase n=1 Tax=Lysobacter sp. K5869 TaxID=2820808 RepID=UPI001C06079F|nr:M56 family metallopeptidase [Lysobacter sp. K5869]QWP74661.1 hypothetical protein J5226_13260 [Lysobacter sp. K5869]